MTTALQYTPEGNQHMLDISPEMNNAIMKLATNIGSIVDMLRSTFPGMSLDVAGGFARVICDIHDNTSNGMMQTWDASEMSDGGSLITITNTGRRLSNPNFDELMNHMKPTTVAQMIADATNDDGGDFDENTMHIVQTLFAKLVGLQGIEIAFDMVYSQLDDGEAKTQFNAYTMPWDGSPAWGDNVK